MARFAGLEPASTRASRAAEGSSRKRDTAPEIRLKSALRKAGVRSFASNDDKLPGSPDIVFRSKRVVVFCDGDFWHGKNLEERIEKLERGHNAPYWIAKIRGNVERDRRRDAELAEAGWTVLRFWESSIKRSTEQVVAAIVTALQAHRKRSPRRQNERRVQKKARER